MIKKTTPLVTVLMSVYNGETWLREAVESILKQNYTNFEFIIIDDGSTDNTLSVLESFEDERIKILKNDTNLGLIASLNKGLGQARGVYIARMDADDISLPHRLERQVAFMEANPDLGASSAWMSYVNEDGGPGWKIPLRHDQLLATLFSYSCLWHPLAMIRKAVLDEYGIRYEKEYYRSEDYKLWTRISDVSRLANLPEVLLRYRLHAGQETRHRNSSQKIREELLEEFLGRPASDTEKRLHAYLHFEVPFTDSKIFREVEEWIHFLVARNREKADYAEPGFSEGLGTVFRAARRRSFYHLIRNKKRYTPDILYYLYLSDRKYYRCFKVSFVLRMSVKSLIFWPNHKYSDQGN